MLTLRQYNFNTNYIVVVQAKYCMRKHLYWRTFFQEQATEWTVSTSYRSSFVFMVANFCVPTAVVFALLPYKKGRSSDKLGQGAVSPASSAWPLDFRSSQRCLRQLIGGTHKLGEDREYSGLRVASCL